MKYAAWVNKPAECIVFGFLRAFADVFDANAVSS